jgi:hypothetical protein
MSVHCFAVSTPMTLWSADAPGPGPFLEFNGTHPPRLILPLTYVLVLKPKNWNLRNDDVERNAMSASLTSVVRKRSGSKTKRSVADHRSH